MLGLRQFPPCTNGSTGEEALLQGFKNHYNSNYYKLPLIIASGSAYVVNTMNEYRATGTWFNPPQENEIGIRHKGGNEVVHSDP